MAVALFHCPKRHCRAQECLYGAAIIVLVCQPSLTSFVVPSCPALHPQTYYYYELLSRTADGDEGGKHQLFAMAVSNNKLYILRHQAGDKRWFKGLERPIKASIAEFTVY